MKKTLMLAVILTLLAALPVTSLAGGATVRIATTLLDIEQVAQAYVDTLSAWETATGNTVDDFSGLPEDIWKPLVLEGLAAGQFDVVCYAMDSSDTASILDKMVPLDEVKAAYPNAAIPVNPLAAEADGKVYAVPVSLYWEALYCNKDLFDTHGLELPTDWDKLGAAVMKFRELGITPIAVSLSDFPQYIVEAAMLASGSPADQGANPINAAGMPGSWVEGMNLIRGLYGAGALGQSATQTDEMESSQAFREKEAAMQFDGSWFAATIPQESWNSTVVVPFPAYASNADPSALIGGMSMGFYITRAAWDDPARREAAVSLLQALTTEDMLAKLGESSAGDALGESIKAMLSRATKLCKPIGERMKPEARDAWFSNISGIAEGSKDAAAVMGEVVDMGAFAE